jgi:mitochondrial distribution and morphology protein 34
VSETASWEGKALTSFRTGLTIPLQITLSDIKLSGFIILVFSRQKGLTLVFRNDPLESLKVSSTFDSIPFVRDYLQKEIEGQLRILLMDELPAIIHRLSLRLWVPEYRAREERETAEAGATSQDEPVVDPFASPPQDPVDSHGHKLNATEIASLSIETGIETQSLFSQKNLLRLATLTDSHRTLSLFTPSIQDVVFRAWAGPTERGEVGGLRSPALTPALSRSHSYSGSTSTTYTFDSASQGRPALQSFGSHSYGLSMGAGRHAKGHGARQRKKRIVNLRKKPETDGDEPCGEDGSTFTDSASVTESTGSAPSIFSAPPALAQELRDEDIEPETPPRSPYATIRQGKRAAAWAADQHGATTRAEGARQSRRSLDAAFETTTPNKILSGKQNGPDNEMSQLLKSNEQTDLDATPRASTILPEKPRARHVQQKTRVSSAGREKDQEAGPSSASQSAPLPNFLQFITDPANGGTIVEQAWMMKMASEIARRYQEEREKGNPGGDAEAPPAYVG